jgi:hypothetical protein
MFPLALFCKILLFLAVFFACEMIGYDQIGNTYHPYGVGVVSLATGILTPTSKINFV